MPGVTVPNRSVHKPGRDHPLLRAAAHPADVLAGTAAGRADQVLTIDDAPWGCTVVDALFVALDDGEHVREERGLRSVGDFT
jgi:hypothetical protein